MALFALRQTLIAPREGSNLDEHENRGRRPSRHALEAVEDSVVLLTVGLVR